jgi:alkyl hydroperoxide reductase subunit AhpC
VDNASGHACRRAAIAMGTSPVVQARKDRHDLAAEWRQIRREMYMTFLSVLAKARNELFALSKKSDMTEAEHDEAARQVFAPCYEQRHHLEVVAPPDVAKAALVYFRTVRGLRNVVAGNGVTEPDWEANARQIKHSLETVQEAMRDDLQRM